MKVSIENNEFSSHIDEINYENEINNESSYGILNDDDDIIHCSDEADELKSTAAKVRSSRRKKRRIIAQRMKQEISEERNRRIKARNEERNEFSKRTRIDNQWENRKRSNFCGLGYQATESRIKASKDYVKNNNDIMKLNGSEWRKLKSNSRRIPIEDMYFAFSVKLNKEGPIVNDVLTFSEDQSEEVFAIIDTGTSVSISDVKGSLLDERKDKNVNIMGFNGSKAKSSRSGTAIGTAIDDNGEVFQIKINDVHDINGAPMDLISVSALVKEGYEFHFTQNASYLTTPDMKVITLIERNGLYFMQWKRTVDPIKEQYSATVLNNEELFINEEDDEDNQNSIDLDIEENEDNLINLNEEENDELIVDSSFSMNESFNSCYSSIPIDTKKKKEVEINLLHQRLAHFHPETIKSMSNDGAFSDVKVSKEKKVHVCETCKSVKTTRNHISSKREGESVRVFNKPFQRVWTDLKGQLPKDLWGNRYMITFTCEVTRWSQIYFIKNKTDVKEKLELFLTWIKKKGWKVEVLNSDGGGEYVGEEIAKVCNDNGIEQQFTAPYTPQQNGISENMNRILTEHASCLLNDAIMNKRFWSLAMRHVCWVRNRMFASALKSSDGKQRSPYQVLFGKNPPIGMLKVFGCDTWRLNHLHRSSSFEPRAFKGIHVGISATHKAWLIYDLKTKKIRLSYHCSFNESFENRKCNLTQYKLRRNKAGPAANTKELAELQLDREVFKCEGDEDLMYSDDKSSGVEERTEQPITTHPKDSNNDLGNVLPEKDTVPIMNESVGELMDLENDVSTQTLPKSGRKLDDKRKQDEINEFDDDDDDILKDKDELNRPVLRSRKESGKIVEDNNTNENNLIIPERKLLIGKIQELNQKELKFLRYAFENNHSIKVQSNNPKLKKSKSRARYEKYKDATTLREFQRFGGTWGDIVNDYSRGYIKFVNEVDEVDQEERDKDSYYANKLKPRRRNDIDDSFSTMTIQESLQHDYALIGKDHIESLTHRRQRLLQRALGTQSLEEFAHCCASRIMIEEPVTVDEALASNHAKEWREAMDEEIDNLIKFQCFEVVEREDAIKHGKLVKSKWVFKVKYNPDGSLQRFRARLVAKGFSQSPYIDYYETFSPVFGYSSLRTILARAAAYSLEIDQWDLKNSFIQQEIDVPHMYMECPDGYGNIIPNTNKRAALHFKKSLYGLKQSSRLLHKRIAGLLKKVRIQTIGFRSMCIYSRCW
jgi:hypothetical protein